MIVANEILNIGPNDIDTDRYVSAIYVTTETLDNGDRNYTFYNSTDCQKVLK